MDECLKTMNVKYVHAHKIDDEVVDFYLPET